MDINYKYLRKAMRSCISFVFFLLVCQVNLGQEFISAEILKTARTNYDFIIRNVEFSGESEVIALKSNHLKGISIPLFFETTKTEALRTVLTKNRPTHETNDTVDINVRRIFLGKIMDESARICEFIFDIEFIDLDGNSVHRSVYTENCSMAIGHSELHLDILGPILSESLEEFERTLRPEPNHFGANTGDGVYHTFNDYVLGRVDTSLKVGIKRKETLDIVRFSKVKKGTTRSTYRRAWGVSCNDTTYIRPAGTSKIGIRMTENSTDTIHVVYSIPIAHSFHDTYQITENAFNISGRTGYFRLNQQFVLSEKDRIYTPVSFVLNIRTREFESLLSRNMTIPKETVYFYHSRFSNADSIRIEYPSGTIELGKEDFCVLELPAERGSIELKICIGSECTIMTRENLRIHPDIYLIKGRKGKTSFQRMNYRDFDAAPKSEVHLEAH